MESCTRPKDLPSGEHPHEAWTKIIKEFRGLYPPSPEEGPLFIVNYWHRIEIQWRELRSGYYPLMLHLQWFSV
jgi:hypothetical protein